MTAPTTQSSATGRLCNHPGKDAMPKRRGGLIGALTGAVRCGKRSDISYLLGAIRSLAAPLLTPQTGESDKRSLPAPPPVRDPAASAGANGPPR